VPGTARPFFIPVVHSPLGPWGTWQHRSFPLGLVRLGPCGRVRAHLGREARSEAKEHVAAPELSSRGGRARSHGTRGSAGAHLGREARSRAEERMAAPELNSARRRGPGPRATWQHRSSPQQGGEVRAAGHVAALKPTSVERCGPKLQLTWQRMDARPAPCIDLDLVRGGTRFLGCRQRPPGPPRERLRTHKWGQFFGAALVYLHLFTRQSTTGPREVPELKVREHPPPM
jgi:hypothetical protein